MKAVPTLPVAPPEARDLVDLARARVAGQAEADARQSARLGYPWSGHDGVPILWHDAAGADRRALVARIDRAMTGSWSADERPVDRFARFARLPPRLVAEAERVDADAALDLGRLLLGSGGPDPAGLYRQLPDEARRELARRINSAVGFEWAADLPTPADRFAAWCALPRRLRAEALAVAGPKPERSGRIARRLAYDRTVGRF